jgi:thiol:disulfide interchange protein
MALWSANIDDFASEQGYYRDYDTAFAVAKKEQKVLMLVMVADYCPWCRKFERKTLSTSEVASKIKEYFVPVIVDRNLDKTHFPKAYDTPRIPVAFFISPKSENVLYESIAYVKKKEFLVSLDEVLGMQKEEMKK